MTESKFKSIVAIIEAHIEEFPDDVSTEIRKDGKYHVIEVHYFDENGKFKTMKFTKYADGGAEFVKSFDGGEA